MRILQLRFLNLNALVGEWEIDFTGPEYLTDGIFAITGPTGAGKTTLLDAICLALYGRTPRLSRINRATNEIMSRQTGECFAEVTYQTQHGHFRSHWGQHRARRRPDGELQAARHEIMDMASGKVLETGLADVARKTEQVTGMDFHRFTRSMLLAQGDFAKFLNASADERAPILEQITGTEIYSQISIQVHTRRAAEQQKLEAMQTALQKLDRLDPAELTSIRQDLDMGSQQLAVLGRHLDHLERQLAWLQQLEESEQTLAMLDSEHQQWKQAWQQASPMRERFQRAARAAVLEPAHARLSTLRSQQAEDTARLARETAELQRGRQQQEVVETALQQARQKLEQVRLARQQAQPAMAHARLLDQQIQQAEQAVQYASQRVQEQAGRLQDVTSERDKAKLAIDEHIRKIQQARHYLEQHASDAGLEAALAGVATQLQALRANQKSSEQVGREQQQARVVRTQAQAALEQAQAEYKRDGQKRKTAQDTLEQHEQALEQLLHGRLPRELQAQKDAWMREQFLLEKIQDLETERTRLQPGEPCPLCGAKAHPFADHDSVPTHAMDAQLAQIEKEIALVHEHEEAIGQARTTLADMMQQVMARQQQVMVAQQKAEQAGAAVAVQSAALQQFEEAARELRQAIARSLSPFGVTQAAEVDASALQALQQRRAQWQHYLSQEKQLGGQRTELDGIVVRLEQQLGQVEQQLQQDRQALEQARGKLAQRQASRQQYLDGADVEAVARSLEQAVETAQQAATEADRAHSRQQQHQAALTARIDSLQQRMMGNADQIARQKQTFSDQLKARGFMDEADFLTHVLDVETRDNLQQQIKALDTERTRLGTRLHDGQQRHQKLLQHATFRPEPEQIVAAVDRRRETLSSLQDRQADLAHHLRRHEQAGREAHEQEQRVVAQQQVADSWDALHQLIGSADGKRFRNFAQGLTFEWMVSHANRQLQEMTDRYVLVHHPSQPLELGVIDNYQAGEHRSTKNLSGGESFIVSLSLALGLSQMSSHRVRVDSLFLDEGFGTLDDEVLDVALDTLANLQHEGRLIGVISHVPALKERIRTQIRVVPVAGGRSHLEGPGCHQPDIS